MSKENWSIETKAVQAGWEPESGQPRVLPIYQSTTYKYDTVSEVADLFDLKAAGHLYSRISNPTCDALEKKMAELEGGVGSIATSSGQSAITVALANVASAGDHIIAAGTLYGGTVTLFTQTFKNMGIEVTFVDAELSLAELKTYVKPNTKAIYGETIANPALDILDFKKFSLLASQEGLPFIVDNTFATAYLCRPFDHGADIVVYSSTKYIDGHATSVGGVIIDKGTFDWGNGKFPDFTVPDPSYHGTVYNRDFEGMAYIVKARVQWLRNLGCTMAPMNAFLSNIGLETLHLRMDRHCSNSEKLAQFLENHPKVGWVDYPGLPNHRHADRAAAYLKGGSGVLTFGVKGGLEEGEKVMNSLKLAAIVVHVCDVRTSVVHPASMTHRQLNLAEQKAAGVTPDLIRVSVGIENVEDIIADFEQALSEI